MAMGPERSKPLHNFSMPCLKWGNQRFLRCVKVTTEPSPLPLDPHQHEQPHKRNNNQIDPFQNSNDDIDAVREKLMIDLRVAANKLKVSIFEEGNGNGNPMPWNLRARRAACKEPHHEDQRNPIDSVGKAKENNKNKKKKKKKTNERAKFSVSLSKEEVEQDFLALVGTRPPRRPKKRPRIVQRQLDTLFPGLWLTEVTAESYKVDHVPE
ncbi:uncharacterized protein LOC133290890 [Gastrolobium bilobum]|uniref:uncharacterized protein LOC133290890 n=1 Tax=Gastrolobium bilobum TaxID=150636 RepID=UPI002AB1D358|nr:uncharacterized protein LOC133290890 [Gastrolobium bilobum]XP_061345021.1 uncharacterized protein LOC133290890 [Gastrolobium bilobum]